MSFLITKADLSDYTRVSQNVSNLLLNPAIRDAHTFDVLPLLHANEVAALAAYLVEPARAAFVVAYQTAELAGFPPADLLALQASPLYRLHVLYATAVRPLLCYETYRRFLLDHGVHLTENGAETISDVGHQPISGQQRTEMRADAATKCSHYRAVLSIALRTYRGAAATATACATRPRRPGAGGFTSSAV